MLPWRNNAYLALYVVYMLFDFVCNNLGHDTWSATARCHVSVTHHGACFFLVLALVNMSTAFPDV